MADLQIWFYQTDSNGVAFVDTYLHPECHCICSVEAYSLMDAIDKAVEP